MVSAGACRQHDRAVAALEQRALLRDEVDLPWGFVFCSRAGLISNASAPPVTEREPSPWAPVSLAGGADHYLPLTAVPAPQRHRVICVSGASPAAEVYAPLPAQLEGRAELIAKDLAGFAPIFPAEYGPDTELEGVDRVAQAAGWTRFHLVGNSMGGTVVLAYTVRHPDRVRRSPSSSPCSSATTPLGVTSTRASCRGLTKRCAFRCPSDRQLSAVP